jgi:hypothetical protein
VHVFSLTRPLLPAAVAAVAACALAGCSAQGSSQGDAAGAAAVRFSTLARSDAVAACTLLAPQTISELQKGSATCAKGLRDADPPAGGRLREVEVYGLDAIARLDADTVFLARFARGWRVTAAGCTPQPEGPYDCDITGG